MDFVLSKKSNFIFIVILIVGTFYVMTIRDGHVWGGDFSMYIHHAKNIVEGIDYEDIGFIYNPSYWIAPKTYPPVFPLLLSPIYKYFGLDLTAMKIEIILIFLCFLYVMFILFRNKLPLQCLVIMIALIGFNPFFWDFKDQIVSDVPFLFFLYLSLLYIDKMHQSGNLHAPKLLNIFFASILIYLSYGTRSFGILLIPSLFIYDVIKFKRPTMFTMMVSLIFIPLMVLQNIYVHGDSIFLSQFTTDYKILTHNLFLCGILPSALWDNGYSKSLRLILFVIVSVPAIAGYLRRVRSNITILEIFPLLYLPLVVAITLLFTQGLRYLIPIIPLYIFYFFAGFEKINFSQKIKKPVFIIILIAIIVSYAGRYSAIDFGPIREGVGKKETLELFDFIKQNTKKEDIFIFEKPRVLTFFTGRSAPVYHRPRSDEDLWNYFHKIKATYIVVGQLFERDQRILRPFIEKSIKHFQKVYSNSDFDVYRIEYEEILSSNTYKKGH
jgi:hypothetical protein